MNAIVYYLFKIYYSIVARLGAIRNIYYRESVMRTCNSYQLPLRVNGPCYISKYTSLGKNVSFNGMRIGGRGQVKIGDNFHSGVGCKIITQIHNYEGDALPYDNKLLGKDTLIGDNVWLGDDVTVLGGVRIGEGAIIQAGSVVVNDIPDCAIAGGHPARVFKKRDLVRYTRLKKEGKYH